MYGSQPIQAQLIQNDIYRSKRYKPQTTTKTFIEKVVEKGKRYFWIFLETSSIHGLNHLVAKGRHACEVSLWLEIVMLSIYGTLFLSRTTWMRYQSSPTVVSMDRDMFAWNTTFPSVTICPDDKIDPDKLDNYLKQSNIEDKDALETFIKALANATYENFDILPKIDGIAPENYMELLINLSSSFKPTLTIGTAGINLKVVPTVTEMGLCYAINSKVAIYNSPEYRAENRWDFVDLSNSSFFVHPLDGEVFAQVINITSSYDVYIHGPLEVPDISTKHQHSEKKFYMKIYVTALTVYTAPEAAKLSVGQRRCRFPHENILQHNSIYTYTMCRMECRLLLSLQYCGCVPHFYRKIGDENICNVEGLQCLTKHKGDTT